MSGTHFLLFLIFCPLLLDGQNIIPNGNFEDTIPSFFGTVSAKNWVNPTNGSPDFYSKYHNKDAPSLGVPINKVGFQNTHSGKSYFGLLLYNFHTPNNSKRLREYIQNKFTKPLVKDTGYCLQFYVSLADSCRFASKNKLGIYFSSNQVNSSNKFYLPYTPQVIVSPDSFITEKEKWIAYNFKYKAQGGEQYITIGNFTDSTEIDTLFVGGGDKNNLNWQGTYYYIDDVYFGHCDSLPVDTPTSIEENNLLSKLTAYPNPVKRQFTLQNNSNKKLSFLLYNTLGSQVNLKIQQSHNNYQFSMGHLPKGIYLLHIIAEDTSTTLKLVKE